MEEIKKNRILLAVLAITILNLVIFGLGGILIEKTATRVIEKLKKDYSPSPYGPGFDPDKISPTSINLTHGGFPSRLAFDEKSQVVSGKKVVWRQNWEAERGFSPLQ
jgi:hypothetical protein